MQTTSNYSLEDYAVDFKRNKFMKLVFEALDLKGPCNLSLKITLFWNSHIALLLRLK